MIGASKILTVSYGTFSCTLEGFDDPFNTMKAIAEYFRDLAAEDRYFGAEPPTPDAAMLHKIAEREIQRRVEAKINENGVILRAGNSLPPQMQAEQLVQAAPVQAAPLPQANPAPAAVQPAPQVEVAPAATKAPAAEAATAPMPMSEASHDPVAESIAAKLTRIRSAVAQGRSPAPVADYVEDELVAPPSLNMASQDMATLELAPAALRDLPAAQPAPLSQPEVASAPEAGFDIVPEPEAGFDIALDPALLQAPAAEVAEDQAAQDIAMEAELAGLLASLDAQAEEAQPEIGQPEVGQHAAEPLSEDDTLDDLLLDDIFAPAQDMLADLSAQTAEALPEMMPDMLPELHDDAAEADLDLAALDLLDPAEAALEDLRRFDAPLETVLEDAPEAEAGAESAPEPEIDLAVLGFAPPVPPAAAVPMAASAEASAEAAPVAESADAGPAVSDRIQRARARVIRIRRHDAEAPTPAEITGETAPAAPALPDAAMLSPEAEADLMRELAEVQAEAKLIPADPAAPARPVRPVRPVRTVAPPPAIEADAGEEAVSRLLAETNSQFAVPENRRRVAAIQQLKAAVAATVADRRAGAARPVNDEDRQTPYRTDLSRMVSPTSEDHTTTPRPLPLVLVLEQRVDRSAANSNGIAAPQPVSPQPVSPLAAQTPVLDAEDLDENEDETLDEANIFTDSRGFAEFADRLGAQGLLGLMEAAAAYTACVEGRPHFSRPQIMRQIAALEGALPGNREDSLRSFGALLRNGKIVKVRRGQYTLSEASHMMSEARKLVG